MQWMPKQLKNLRLSVLALALPFAFCLVGLPRVVNAQNLSTKVGDASLDEFMAAFANAFENLHYVTVQPTDDYGLGPSMVVIPVDWDSNDLGTQYLQWNGLSVASSAYVNAVILRMMEDAGISNLISVANGYVSSEAVSNIVNSLAAFWSDYLTSEFGVTTSAYLFDSLYNAAESFLYEYPDRNLIYSGAGSAFQPADHDNNGDPVSGTWITGVSSEKPESMIATFDWWTHEAVEAAAEDIKDSLESLPQALYIQDGWTNLLEAVGALTNTTPLSAWSRLQELSEANDSRKNEILDIEEEINQQLTNSLNSVQDAGLTFATFVSNRVTGLYEDLQDIVSLFDEQNRSSVVNLIPSLESYKGVLIPTLSLDLDDDRFTMRGRFVTALRWCCLLCWYVSFVIAMWYFIRRAIHVAQHIIAE